MVKQLNTKDPSALRKWFHVLRQRVSVFSNTPNGNEYQELISAVLRFDNWENAELTEEFISLVSDLVSSNGCYVIPCFQVLVKNFLPRYKTNISNTSVEFDAQTSLAVGENTHRALKKLLTIVPSSPSALFSLLMEMFPHKRLDLTAQVTYVSNLLRIAAYCVVLRDRLLALIVEKIIQLDVSFSPPFPSCYPTKDVNSFSSLCALSRWRSSWKMWLRMKKRKNNCSILRLRKMEAMWTWTETIIITTTIITIITVSGVKPLETLWNPNNLKYRIWLKS